MKAADIKLGGRYMMKVSGSVVPVIVNAIVQDYTGRTRYDCTNTFTGRKVTARSAAKFRSVASSPGS